MCSAKHTHRCAFPNFRLPRRKLFHVQCQFQEFSFWLIAILQTTNVISVVLLHSCRTVLSIQLYVININPQKTVETTNLRCDHLTFTSLTQSRQYPYMCQHYYLCYYFPIQRGIRADSVLFCCCRFEYEPKIANSRSSAPLLLLLLLVCCHSLPLSTKFSTSLACAEEKQSKLSCNIPVTHWQRGLSSTRLVVYTNWRRRTRGLDFVESHLSH